MRPYHTQQLAVIFCILAVTFLCGMVKLYRACAVPTPPSIPAAAAVYEIQGVGVRAGFYSFSSAQRVCDVLEAAGVVINAEHLPTARIPSGTKILFNTVQPSEYSWEITEMAAAARLNFFLPLDINSASVDELKLIPGVGTQTARAIVAYRAKHGRIKDIKELCSVPGLGEKKIHALCAYVNGG